MKMFWSLVLAIVLLTVGVLVFSPGSKGRGPLSAGPSVPSRTADPTNSHAVTPAPNDGAVAGSRAERPARPGQDAVAADRRPPGDHTGDLPSSQQRTQPGDRHGEAASVTPDGAGSVPHTATTGGTAPLSGAGEPLAPASRVPGEPLSTMAVFVRVSDPVVVSDWLDRLLHLPPEPAGVIRVDGPREDTAGRREHQDASRAHHGRDAQHAATDPPASAAHAPTASDDPNLLAGRYALRGSGTRDDPYQIPWDALVAVRETYRPRSGLNDLPAWLERIDGKHIVLTGYLMTPLVQQTTDEVLLMRNQWDGCCIGVPPTPYDGIEVKLNRAISGQSSWRMNYGTVAGKLIVDPYIVSGWLMGLYLLEDAELIDSGW